MKETSSTKKIYILQWHTPVIPAIQEEEVRRIPVQGKSRQRVSKTLSQQNKMIIVVHACPPRYSGGVGRRMTIQGHRQQKA
jgi:hypothetical protein